MKKFITLDIFYAAKFILERFSSLYNHIRNHKNSYSNLGCPAFFSSGGIYGADFWRRRIYNNRRDYVSIQESGARRSISIQISARSVKVFHQKSSRSS